MLDPQPPVRNGPVAACVHRLAWAWTALLAVVVLSYAPGLSGPLLFDDLANLGPLVDWQLGTISWAELVFQNGSGPLGRPVAMLTFWFNGAFFGDSIFCLKLVNLIIHLGCGIVLYQVTLRLADRDQRLKGVRTYFAFVVSAIWMLHPTHVNTVLYTVQRMAQLSAFFSLLSALAFQVSMNNFERGRHRAGMLALWLLLPLFTVLATLSKENGILAPILCLSLYLCLPWSDPARSHARFFFKSLALLAIFTLATGIFSGYGQTLLEGFEGREFTLVERALTQPRALSAYLYNLILPSGSQLGIYTDDFELSRSLWQPSTTLLAIVFVAILVGAAVASRKRFGIAAAGVLFFFAGHLVESTILPLELYFEHRNYLPSCGVIVTAVCFGFATYERLRSMRSKALPYFHVASLLVLAALWAATNAQSAIWQSEALIVQQALKQHPESIRAHVDTSRLHFERGDYHAAIRTLQQLQELENVEAKRVAKLYILSGRCQFERRYDDQVATELKELAGDRITLSQLIGFTELRRRLSAGLCPPASPIHVAELVNSYIQSSTQPEHLKLRWSLRAIAGELYLQAGRPDEAVDHLRISWDSGADLPAIGGLLVTALHSAKLPEEAIARLSELEHRTPLSDLESVQQIQRLRLMLDQ